MYNSQHERIAASYGYDRSRMAARLAQLEAWLVERPNATDATFPFHELRALRRELHDGGERFTGNLTVGDTSDWVEEE